MQDVTSAHSKSFPNPRPRLGAKQSTAFIRGESQISPAKDNLYLTEFMGEKPPTLPHDQTLAEYYNIYSKTLTGGW